IGEFLKRNKTAVAIEDDKTYKRATIKVRNGGIFLRDEEIGSKIGTKNQFLISKGQFLLSKIDARNGAFGVVPEVLDGGITTGNFWTFDVDYNIINPHYLALLTTTEAFVQFCEQASNGTTNRHYLQEPLFLNIKVPVPSLEEQNKLVKEYNKQISLARNLGEKARQEELDIHAYILSKLGVKLPNHKLSQEAKNRELISFVNYKDVDRWDMWSKEQYIHSLQNQSIYKSVQLGALDFVGRSWKKDSESFRYIEMSDVDPIFGIVNDTIISTKDAPSRATQSVNTGDLIIGTTRPYLKRFAIVTSKHNNCICSSAFQVIKPNKNYNLEYVYYFLQTQLAIMQFEAFMTGALYPAINTSDLGRIKIILPPLSVQEMISRYANKKRAKVKQYILQSKKGSVEALTNFETKIFE
ncbi:MAG: restriction endonuclease subunit S, partial [Alistipes sp.]|nr:restriction endonuclease subunit S [Alistipes sp.]